MKKFISGIFAALVLITSVFGAEGLMWQEKNIRVVQSQWFDIIYSEECEDSARFMQQEADKIYCDLADMYGYKNPPCRMPVVLTTNSEIFNAYFSAGYYNHIILYVTSPVDECNFEPDTLLWTFRHELTHAFTYNMKNDFFKFCGQFFTDGFDLGIFSVTPGMAEGATLTSESYEGSGRLNDEFARQYVKQAVIEGKFPRFSDVQGSRDIYPAGGYYYFNGAFHEYLQKTYGMEKYAAFWYNAINNSVTVSRAFKKAYGIKLKAAWKDFEKSYEVPEVQDGIKTGLAKDFFNQEAEKFSVLNSKGLLVENMSISQKGLLYVDSNNYSAFFVAADDLQQDKIKPVKLFQLLYLDKAVQSADGKFVAATYYDGNTGNYRYHAGIFNTETKEWYKSEENGLKDASIIKKENDYYLVCLKFAGEKSWIKISHLDLDENGKIKGESEVKEIPFARNELGLNFTDLGNGKFAYIYKSGLNFSVQTADVEGTVLETYNLSETLSSAAGEGKEYKNFIIRYLSADASDSDVLYFSWAAKGTMPRLGKINLAEKKISLGKEDLSGGVYLPCVNAEKLYFTGLFYEQNRLFKGDVNNFNFDEIFINSAEKQQILAENTENQEKTEEKSEKTEILEFNPVSYNPLSYMKRGLWLPFTDIKSSSYDLEHYGADYLLPFGITYITSNPWDANVMELSAGYGFQTNSWGFLAKYSGGTTSSLFNYELDGQVEFDSKGFKSTDGSIEFSSLIQFANYSRFNISQTNVIHYGRSNAATLEEMAGDITSASQAEWNWDWVGMYGSQDKEYWFYEQNGLVLQYSAIRPIGDGRFSKDGLTFGVAPFYFYSRNMTEAETEYSFGDITFFGEVYIPCLLPVNCVYGKTYNLPCKIVAAAFSTNSVTSSLIQFNSSYTAPTFAYIGGETILYGQEIQKAIPFMPFIFVNDLKISLAGVAGYDYFYGTYVTGGLRFTNLQSETDLIFDGTNRPYWNATLKATAGGNLLNFGVFARYSNKIYGTVSFSLFDRGAGTQWVFDAGTEINF